MMKIMYDSLMHINYAFPELFITVYLHGIKFRDRPESDPSFISNPDCSHSSITVRYEFLNGT